VYKEVAKLYDEQGLVEEEREIWAKVRDLAPDDPDVDRRFSELSGLADTE
jgi:hypothetical protein